MRTIIASLLIIFISIGTCYASSAKDVIELNKLCADETLKYVDSKYGLNNNDILKLSFDHHYNVNRKTCYIIVSAGPNRAGSEHFIVKKLMDHSTTKYIGSYIYSIENNIISECFVENIACNTEGDFELLVKPYMTQ